MSRFWDLAETMCVLGCVAAFAIAMVLCGVMAFVLTFKYLSGA